MPTCILSGSIEWGNGRGEKRCAARRAGNALLFNVSTDSTGGFRCEILDEHGNVLPGYSRTDCICSRGIGGGYIWVSRDPEKMIEDIRLFNRPIAGDHFGDSQAMLVGWRLKRRDDPGRGTRMMLYVDGDISELKGKTVRLRIIAHGADLFSFITADRRPVEGATVKMP